MAGRCRPPTATAITTLRIDPHVHTAASYDAFPSVDEVLARAVDAGLDGVVVTDHDRIEASHEAVDRAAEFGLLALPGVEVSTANGHLLAIGVETCPEPGRPLRETVAAVRGAGGVAVVPHPFQRSRHGVPASTLREAASAEPPALGTSASNDPGPGHGSGAGDERLPADGVEVYNAHSLTGIRNGQAASYAARRGYPTFGGSDAHRARLVGRGYTEIAVDADGSVDRRAVLDAMRAGRTAAVGRRMPVHRYLGKVAESVRIRAAALR